MQRLASLVLAASAVLAAFGGGVAGGLVATPASAAGQVMCNMLYQPVCGRNGHTYPNRCHARRAGVKVRHTGACSANSSTIPAPAPTPEPAPSGASQTMCPMIYQPVCGADGKTYPNQCHATRAGAKVSHTGAC
ncbi:MAG TPA: Kazal-type serine protease inhibitor domain-containing protein [Caulobacteraceae bacterium]|jgi:hypothetical protein